jgi:hypothetical protein
MMIMNFKKLFALLFLRMSMSEGEGGGFMGGSSTDGEGGSNGNPPAGAGDGTTVQYSYPEGLDSSYHGNATLLKYANDEGQFNQAEIMKALIHANTAIGSEKIAVPNKNFTEEQWRETFHKLGLPKDVAEYAIENNVAEGQTANEEMFNGFKELAHAQGILPKQAQAIVDYFNGQMQGQATSQTERVQQEIAEGRASLEKEWGAQFDANMQNAEMALNHFFPTPEEQKEIAATGFLDTVAGTKFFAMLASGLREDSFDDQTKGGFGMTKEAIDQRIGDTHKRLTEMGRQHPQYQGTLEEYNRLLRQRHGNTPVTASQTVARV